MKQKFCVILAMIALLSFAGCSFSHTDKRLDIAESLLESRPDSALMILDSISASDIHGRREKARYAFLKYQDLQFKSFYFKSAI